MKHLAQNIMESGVPIDEVIGDFHDGLRYRLVTIQIMGQLLAETLDWLDSLIKTVGWQEQERGQQPMCNEHEKDALRNIRWVVDRQAEDEAMCEQSRTPEEAYFRRELLRLHSIIGAYCDQLL